MVPMRGKMARYMARTNMSQNSCGKKCTATKTSREKKKHTMKQGQCVSAFFIIFSSFWPCALAELPISKISRRRLKAIFAVATQRPRNHIRRRCLIAFVVVGTNAKNQRGK